jgi:signal peptidase I
MYPTLQENDTLFLENVTLENIKVGDLVVFKGKDKTICHRIVSKRIRGEKLEFREKGDNCVKANLLLPKQIIARVKEVYRGRQHWLAYNPKLARFNILMTAVFYLSYLLSRLKRLIFPTVRFPRLSCAIIKALRRINRWGNQRWGG